MDKLIPSRLKQPPVLIKFRSSAAKLADPWVQGRITYPLVDLCAIVLLAACHGHASWYGIHKWAENHLADLQALTPTLKGRPSQDTIARTTRMIPPHEFQTILIDPATDFLRRSLSRDPGRPPSDTISKVLAIDGKTLIGAKLPFEDKSKVHAMGARKAIAERIIDSGADYLSRLKRNHANLHDQEIDTFEKWGLEHPEDYRQKSHTTDYELVGGRVERRTVNLVEIDATSQARVNESLKWRSIRSVVKIRREVSPTDPREKETLEDHYFLSSVKYSPERMIRLALDHWDVETLRYRLDKSYREDDAKAWRGNGPEILSVLREARPQRDTPHPGEAQEDERCHDFRGLRPRLPIPHVRLGDDGQGVGHA